MSRSNLESVPQARDERLTARFSAAEIAQVRRAARARGLPASAYMRGAVCEAAGTSTSTGVSTSAGVDIAVASPPLTAQQVAVIDAARIDHKRLSVNLNQLMRLVHRGEVHLGRLAPVIAELKVHTDWLVEVLAGRRSL